MTIPTVNPSVPLEEQKPKNEPKKNDKSAATGESLRSKDEMPRAHPVPAAAPGHGAGKAPVAGERKKGIKP